MKQLDLFGGEIDVSILSAENIRLSSRKTKTMQEMFGTIQGKYCKTCKHCYKCRRANVWYKCELWDDFFRGSSSASDIRLKNQACKKYEEVVK